jgi:hypothetical protein
MKLPSLIPAIAADRARRLRRRPARVDLGSDARSCPCRPVPEERAWLDIELSPREFWSII